MKRNLASTGSIDPRPGGAEPPFELPKQSPGVELFMRMFRTIFFTLLFLIICKLTHFRTKILYDVRINRKFLGMFYLFSACFTVLYLYMLFTLRILRPPNRRIPVDNWDKAAPIPMYSGTACLVGAVICFIFGLWPCFHLMTFVIGVLGFITFIFIMQWIPF